MEKRKLELEKDFSYGMGANNKWRGVYLLIGLNIALGLMLIAFEVPLITKSAKLIVPAQTENSWPLEWEMTPATQIKPKVHLKPPPPPMKKTAVVLSSEVKVVNKVLSQKEPVKLAALDDDLYASLTFEGDDPNEKDFTSSDFKPKKEVYEYAEVQPEFPGGIEEFYKFLYDEIRYPADARELHLTGKTWLSFVVNTDGSLTGFKIKGRSISHSIDKEVFRSIAKSPNWKPGMVNGKAVPVRYTLPIVFKLDANS